jgi:nitrite reductase (NO-forming)
MLEADPDAKAMLKKYNGIAMPNQNLSDAETDEYIKYFRWVDAQPADVLYGAEASH